MNKMLEEISEPISINLDEFDKHFNDSLKSEVKIINTIVKYIVRKKGKRLRPRLCLLSAKICGGINNKTYKIASLFWLQLSTCSVNEDPFLQLGILCTICADLGNVSVNEFFQLGAALDNDFWYLSIVPDINLAKLDELSP